MSRLAVSYDGVVQLAARILHGLAAFAAGECARLVHLQCQARERQTLAELDERSLKDMGLSRTDVAAELRKPLVWR